jgi:hypothetical protein
MTRSPMATYWVDEQADATEACKKIVLPCPALHSVIHLKKAQRFADLSAAKKFECSSAQTSSELNYNRDRSTLTALLRLVGCMPTCGLQLETSTEDLLRSRGI